MGLFSKKKKKDENAMPNVPASSNLPVDQIAAMIQQGYNNDQIVQALQGQGYTPPQIYDAINQASMGAMQDYGAQQPMQQQYQQPAVQTQHEQRVDEQKMQEIAEAVIEEKWEELAKDIKAVIEWKNKTEAKMLQIEQKTNDIKASLDSLNASLLGKLNQYDKNLTDVGTEIKAMEKVFQNILPTLTENVAKLERISKGGKTAPLLKK
ncbi:hypothetical protein HYU10_01690 [Candidatus Woesearchaeota archaeon]|nr:hypothetical protein [Candidatus Woesearchaeota archaeon]MBI2130458.1 hypothetical protein [Candidatus Woesearchaeota archaeon]